MITPQYILDLNNEIIIDNFAGGGGASTGIELALGRHVDVAINHDPEAVSIWHNLVFYRRLAEVAGEYLKKGSQVYIEGKLQTRKWQTKEGQDRYTTEIIVNEMTMLGGKSQSGDHSAPVERDSNPAGRPGGSSPKPAPDGQPSAGASTTKTGAFDNFDDSIPF